MNNGSPVQNNWYLVSSHGAVLFYVALNPGCTIREIAEQISLTQRTVWGLIGDLRRAEMLEVRRDGRRHHYTVNLEAQFRQVDAMERRAISGTELEDFLREGRLGAYGRQP